MKEELNQKISQFLDDELPYGEALGLLQKIRSDEQLAQKLGRYETISHALKTDQFLVLRSDFSATIAAQLADEPTHLIPRKKPINRNYRWLALAASVAFVSVLAMRSLPHLGNTDIPTQTTLQIAQKTPPKALPSSPVDVQKPDVEEQPLNARINDYLQAHNGSVYANNPNLKSMARVTTYNQK